MTFINPDVVDLTYQKLTGNTDLNNEFTIMKNINHKVLPKTAITGRTLKNKLILINKFGGGAYQKNTGNNSAQLSQQVRIEIYVKTYEHLADSQDETKDAQAAIREIMFKANFDGTGIADWHELTNRNPSQPMKTRAAHYLVYEFLTVMGNS